MKKKKKTNNRTKKLYQEKKWPIIIAILAILFIVLLLLPKLRLIGFLSKQGQIDLASLTGDYDQTKNKATFNNKEIIIPPNIEDAKNVILGETNDNKRIEIDLTNQHIYSFEGDRKVYDFPVSTGKWGSTPTGDFRIWTKLRYVLMTGGSQALGTYYYLPNVPFTMFFYNNEVPSWQGYGIHGTYWHNNFGHPMSHGCINMRTEDAEQLYYWANPGTLVRIYGVTPQE